ncbi:MAG: TonB-dependent receptor [Pseudomonadales bacterium]|nr:TonB-dependent receptor [Pseudomonadales bacterium]
MKNLIAVAVATATAFTPIITQAEQRLDDHILVTTATRSEQALKNSLSSAVILSEVEIDRAQAQSLPELLDHIPGLDIDHSGGLGSLTSLRLRGTENDHVLVLIDGVRAASATSGTTALTHLPVTQIERVELVRGPRSSLYGSDAIGGVVQIFTKKAKENSNPISTSATAHMIPTSARPECAGYTVTRPIA